MGGNNSAGIDNVDVSCARFVQNTLGVTVLANGGVTAGARLRLRSQFQCESGDFDAGENDCACLGDGGCDLTIPAVRRSGWGCATLITTVTGNCWLAWTAPAVVPGGRLPRHCD